MDLGGQTVLKKLRMTDVNILSPIEALNLLAELKQDLQESLRRGGEARMKGGGERHGASKFSGGRCAWVLGLMGAFFLLFGGAVLLWDIPVGGRGARLGLPAHRGRPAGGGGVRPGLPGPAAEPGAAAAEGTAVSGTVRSVRHHIFVTWNTQSFVNVPGRNSPWSAVCGYTWGGWDYTVSTGLLWGSPRRGEALVWLDPDRPGRAFVDPDSVRWTLWDKGRGRPGPVPGSVF